MELKIENLSKTYANGVQALKNLNLNISTGMFGLLGPNGSGKSTLMRTIAALQEPDEGTIIFDGINVIKDKHSIREVLGYLPQEFGLYPKITAENLLSHLAELKGISNKNTRKELVDYLLNKTNLWDFRKKNLGGYSGGMKQRFGIAQALIGNPKLIIVDEPTAGLDPAERNRFHNILSEIGENIVVILSSHIIEDIESLCRNMAIIYKGELLMAGNTKTATENLNGNIWRKIIDKDKLNDYKNYKVISHKLFEGKTEIHVYSENTLNNGFEQIKPTLEDVYFSTISLKEN